MPTDRKPNWFEDPHVNLTPGQRYTAFIVVMLAVLMLRIGLPRGGNSLGIPSSPLSAPSSSASISPAPAAAPAPSPSPALPGLPTADAPAAVPVGPAASTAVPPTTEADSAVPPSPAPAPSPPPQPTTTTTTTPCQVPNLPAVGGLVCTVP